MLPQVSCNGLQHGERALHAEQCSGSSQPLCRGLMRRSLPHPGQMAAWGPKVGQHQAKDLRLQDPPGLRVPGCVQQAISMQIPHLVIPLLCPPTLALFLPPTSCTSRPHLA